MRFATTPCAAAKLEPTLIERVSSTDDAWVRSFFASGPDHPVIFDDATEYWPARVNWSMANFARNYGADLGFLKLGFHEARGGKATTLGDFVAQLDQPSSALSGFWIDKDYRPVAAPDDPENLWSFLWEGLATHPDMAGAVGPYPHGAQDLFEGLDSTVFAALETITRNKYLALYLSRKETITPWHFDLHSTIGSLAQFEGCKRVILMPGHDGDDSNQNAGFDPENPDYERYPQMAGRPVFTAILEPGEMLIIPPDWWHYVRSLSHSITLSYNFVTPENAERFLASVSATSAYQAAPPEKQQLIAQAFAPERIAMMPRS